MADLEVFSPTEQSVNLKMSVQGAVDEQGKTLSFLAISKNPKIKQFEWDWKEGKLKYYYLEVLTDNLNFQATQFYRDHNLRFESAIGVIKEHKLDESGHKVVVQFFEDVSDSLEAFNRYKNGLSQSVSVGIINPKIVNTKQTYRGLPLKRMTKGDVIELSAVWRGADEKAMLAQFAAQQHKGVPPMTENTQEEHLKDQINALAEQLSKMQTERVNLNAPTANTPPSSELQDLQSQLTQLQAKEANNAQILQLGSAMGKEKEALEAIKDNKSYQEFSFSLISSQYLAQKPPEKQEFSPVCSLANYALNVANQNASRPVELSMGVHGLEIDDNYMMRFDAMSSIDPKNTGYVPNVYRADKFIQQVFQESNILNLCDKMTGLSGVVEIPRETGKLEAYWVAEGGTTTTTHPGADKITLTPKTIKCKVLITRQMFNMTPIALEAHIIKRIREEIKGRLEADLLYGKGDAKCPFKGIFATTGVNVITDYLSAPDFVKTISFGSKLTSQNLNTDRVVFVANALSKAKLQTSRYDTTGRSDRYLLNEAGDLLCGYAFLQNNRLRDYQGVFGDFSNIILGTWNNLQVQALKNDEGDIVFTGFYDVAIGFKDPKRLVITKRNNDVI
ncbi:phage major capsid protein [Helicobacter salomonis]|uniref:phage major capsid protein n=1 Tax=Helicobacter salomonis TaxID=56878 RepID=UPI000CF03580|nr:phage major capsid protein [Helicobacter salomonis]